jgi:hypothetical protein
MVNSISRVAILVAVQAVLAGGRLRQNEASVDWEDWIDMFELRFSPQPAMDEKAVALVRHHAVSLHDNQFVDEPKRTT